MGTSVAKPVYFKSPATGQSRERCATAQAASLHTVPENSTSVLLREIVCGCSKVVLIEDEDEK